MHSLYLGVVKFAGGCHLSIWWFLSYSMLNLVRQQGPLIIPAWKSTPFWRIICCPDGVCFAKFIHRWLPVQYYRHLFRSGRSDNSIGDAMDENTTILALFVDFTRIPRSFKAGSCTYI